MSKTITTYLGNPINDSERLALFEKWAEHSFPVEAFEALYRNALSANRMIAETFRWQLLAISDHTLNVVDAV